MSFENRFNPPELAWPAGLKQLQGVKRTRRVSFPSFNHSEPLLDSFVQLRRAGKNSDQAERNK